MRHTKRSLAVLGLFILLALLTSVPSSAGEGGTGIDIQAWLQDPGVKLLAIDFYTEGCPPCRAAAPKWKRLQATYASQGFRLATISVGMDYCPALDWTPDYKGCDEDNKIGKAWKVTKLPDAFLYTWQGKPLLEHGTVEQAEAIIKQYFSRQPRILVDTPTGANGAALPATQALDLRAQVKEQLRLKGKVILVPDAKEEAEIKRLRLAAHRASVNEDFCAAMGINLPENSRLSIQRFSRSGEEKLLLELKSLDADCPGATALEVIRDGDVAMAVNGATVKLLRQLFGSLATPSDDTRPTQGGVMALGPRASGRPSGPQAGGGTDFEEGTAPSGPSSKKGAVTAALAQLSIKATPAEATISVSGAKKFADSASGKWLREDLVPGTYKVKAEAAGYESQEKSWTLEPDGNEAYTFKLLRLGVLEVTGTPEKAKVEISGPGGYSLTKGLSPTAPIQVTDAARGDYTIKVSKTGYEAESFSATVEPGKTATVRVALKTPGTLEITGEPAGSKVEVSGPNNFHDEGGLPMTIEGAWRGAYKVKVSREGYGAFEDTAEVTPGQTKRVLVKLEKLSEKKVVKSGASADGATWTDPASRLTWQVTPADKQMNWSDAQAYCSGLSGGWHLPTKDELSSLIRKDAQGCKWPSEMKGECNWYWSSSSCEGNGRYAWVVAFGSGGVYGYGKGISTVVRCVR